MDSKERFLRALAHRKPDRAPFNFWMDRRLMAKYEQRLGHRHWRVTHYGADVIETFAHLLAFPSGPGIERDGTWWQMGPFLKSWDSLDSLPLPDPKADQVYSLINRDLEEFPRTAVILDCPTPWGVIAGIRTYELAYMDMLDHPREFKTLARRVADIQKVVVEKACRMGITALYMMEDIATSRGLAMSPAMIQEFCLDFIREHVQIARSFGVPVLFHSDGKITDALDLLLSAGCCAVNPLQPHLNELRDFKARYGSRLALYGGLDNCFVIPKGTTADVRTHVLEVFDTIGRPDGALIFSTHDIPLHTPPENIETMVRTIKEECIY
jgi:uroporphyrinogen decarboxylase